MEDLIIEIDGKEYKTRIYEGNHNVTVNDNPYNVKLFKKHGKNIFSYTVNNKICHIEVDLDKYKDGKINMDGFTFDIAISNETRKLLTKYIKQSGSSSSNGANIIKAPMPGLIVKVHVEVGQEIQAGENVIIIEAMKMENVLQSTAAGIVKSVKVKDGQSVNKDAVLIELEQ